MKRKPPRLRLVVNRAAPARDPDPDTLRPFRLRLAGTGEYLPHRYYAMSLNAHKAAHWEVNFIKVGETIEVLKVDKGMKCLGQYTKTPTGTRVWWAPREQMSWKALKKA